MTCSERRGTNDVDVVLDSHTGSLFGSLEQRTHIHVEATVGITCCHYLCTTVVTILTHLGNENTWTATFLLGKLVGKALGLLEFLIVLRF